MEDAVKIPSSLHEKIAISYEDFKDAQLPGLLDPIDVSDQIRVEFTELSSRVEIPKALRKDKNVVETVEVSSVC